MARAARSRSRRRAGHVVVVTDPRGDVRALQALQARAEDLVRRLRAAAQSGSGVFSGADPTGSVEVQVTSAGAPTAVRVAADWRDRLSLDGLGAAVVQACTAAVAARVAAWGAGLTQQHGDIDAGEPATDVSGFEPGDPTSRQSQVVLEELLSLIFEVDDQIPALRADAQAVATASVQTRNAAHTIVVTTVGGALTRVDIDRGWLRSAHHDRVAGAMAETLAAAYQADTDRRRQAGSGGPAVERLRDLTQSPERLLREVGLIR